jgi:hypothetical protein
MAPARGGAAAKKGAAQASRPRTAPVPAKKIACPQSELGLTVDLTFHFSARHPTRTGDLVINGSRAFKDVPAIDHLKLFLHKVAECSKLCDFETPEKDEKAKVTKIHLLKHLIDCFREAATVEVLVLDAMKQLYQMISINLFRSMPVVPIRGPLDAHDTVIEDAWPHLSLVYQLVPATFVSPYTQECLTSKFVYGLIGNGASLDNNERQAVKDVLNGIYVRYMGLRQTIRTFMGDKFVIGQCSSDLLQFFSTCINGFNAPLKPEHVKLFRLCFNQLHSHPELWQFAEPMMECLCKFVSKQPAILTDILRYLYQHWPRSERRKQVIYLKELQTLLVNHVKELTQDHVVVAFRILNNALYSEFSDIGDQAINMLTNSKVIDVIMKYAAVIYPIIFVSVVRSAKQHWDETIRANTVIALQALQAIDPELFKKMNEERLSGGRKGRTMMLSSFQTNWLTIVDMAKAADPSITSINFGAIGQF